MELFGLVDWLFGCSHRRTTFPRTLRSAAAAGRVAKAETYVACLQCGRRIPYDWGMMRIGGRRAADIQSTTPAMYAEAQGSARTQ